MAFPKNEPQWVFGFDTAYNTVQRMRTPTDTMLSE
jgi:hypothetical protein